MKILIDNKLIDLTKGIDISLPLSPNKGATAWYCEPVKIWPVETETFIGKVSKGGSTNFNNIQLNPHGNGTHTENVGHISKKFYSINDSLKTFHFLANLVTLTPKPFYNKRWQEEDLIIDDLMIENSLKTLKQNKALIIRTLPNEFEKKNKNYSHTNPPYITEKAVEVINSFGIEHLLIDLPSVDRENDNGELKAHRKFWNYPKKPLLHKTITELVFIDNLIPDGEYFLNLQIISVENDASPSKPVIYKLYEQ
ncbi:MAG TPA: cyclase family protein [Crocinitomix sp.]|nr:cyclase family protein [Crocinitomix sp.]